jgi:hypothetical protein
MAHGARVARRAVMLGIPLSMYERGRLLSSGAAQPPLAAFTPRSINHCPT